MLSSNLGSQARLSRLLSHAKRLDQVSTIEAVSIGGILLSASHSGKWEDWSKANGSSRLRCEGETRCVLQLSGAYLNKTNTLKKRETERGIRFNQIDGKGAAQCGRQVGGRGMIPSPARARIRSKLQLTYALTGWMSPQRL